MARRCRTLLCLVAVAAAAAAAAVHPTHKNKYYSSLTTNNQQVNVGLPAGRPHYWIRQVEAPGVVQLSNLTLMATAPNLLQNSEMNVLLMPLSHSCLLATSTSTTTSSSSGLCDDWTDLGLAAKSPSWKDKDADALIWCCTASLQKQGLCPQGEGYRYTATSTLILNRTKFQGQWSHLPKLTTSSGSSSGGGGGGGGSYTSDRSMAVDTETTSKTKGYRVTFDVTQSGYYALLMLDCRDNDDTHASMDDMQEPDNTPDSFYNTIQATAMMQFQSVHGLLAPPLFPLLHVFTGLVVLYALAVAGGLLSWTTPPPPCHDTLPNKLIGIQKFIVGIVICGLCANGLQTTFLWTSNQYTNSTLDLKLLQTAAIIFWASILRALQRLATAYILLDICSYTPCRNNSHGCHSSQRQTGMTCCIWMLHVVHLTGVSISSSLAAFANHTHIDAMSIMANALASASMIVYAGWILWELFQTLRFLHQEGNVLQDVTTPNDNQSMAPFAAIIANSNDDDNRAECENTINTSPKLTPLMIRSPPPSSRLQSQPQSSTELRQRQLFYQLLGSVLGVSLVVSSLLYWKFWGFCTPRLLLPTKQYNDFQRDDEDQYVWATENERQHLLGQATEQILSWILLFSIRVIFVWQWECRESLAYYYCCARTADVANGGDRNSSSRRDFHGMRFSLLGTTGGGSDDCDTEQEEYNDLSGDSSNGESLGAEIELIPCCTRKEQQYP